jgi:hypothetical protein
MRSRRKSALTRFPMTHKVVQGLGWFSIALGLAELIMPRTLARTLGMRGREGLLRTYGLREVATGVGILMAKRHRGPWVWGRLAGDAVDFATLASQTRAILPRTKRNVAIAYGAVAAATVVDLACAAVLTDDELRRPGPVARDYSNRSGFPKPIEQMRGVAADAAAGMASAASRARNEQRPRLHS